MSVRPSGVQLFTHGLQWRWRESNSRPEALSERTYILSCFLFISPAVTAEATKHHGKLAQIGLTLRPPEHGSFGAACLSYASSRHTGDAGGNVAEIRQPVLVRYSRLCFSKLDNAGHGPRYASITSESPVETWHPQTKHLESMLPALGCQGGPQLQQITPSPRVRLLQPAVPLIELLPSPHCIVPYTL